MLVEKQTEKKRGGEGKSSDFKSAYEAEGRKRGIYKDYDDTNKKVLRGKGEEETEPVWKSGVMSSSKTR